MKKLWMSIIMLTALAMGSQAATITSTTTNGTFDVAATWVDGIVPVSTNDSVVLASRVILESDFTIGNGQSMTAATTSGRLQLGDGHFTVATGGTLDLVTGALAYMTESGAGGHFTIEAGATVKVDRYWNDENSPAYVNEWIADAAGVTTFEAGRFTLRGTSSELRVDLSNYDLVNGTTLVLVETGLLSLQNQVAGDNGWHTITLTGGWAADLDVDVGTGLIRLINISTVADTNAPVITLLGDNPMDVAQGTAFVDPGATALDDVDGDISTNIVVTGSVDANTAGIYTLDYDVSDAASNAATTVTRTVNVSAPTVVTWDGDAADGLWATALNWSGDALPTAFEIITISNAVVTVPSDFLPANAVLNLTGTASIGGTGVTRFFNAGGTINVGSQATIMSANQFWDIRDVTFNFDSGAQAGAGIWELKNNPTFQFNLDASGFTTINTSRLKGETDTTNLTWQVDMANYTGSIGTITLIDWETCDSGDPDKDITAATFQESTLNILNGGDYAGTLSFNETENSIELEVVLSTSTYATWADSFGLTGADTNLTADVEPDGLDNLMEYGLGGDPTTNDAAAIAPVSYIADDAGTDYLYHVHNQRTDDSALSFTVGATPDLVATPADPNEVSLVGESAESGGFKSVTNRTEASTDAKFINLTVEK